MLSDLLFGWWQSEWTAIHSHSQKHHHRRGEASTLFAVCICLVASTKQGAKCTKKGWRSASELIDVLSTVLRGHHLLSISVLQTEMMKLALLLALPAAYAVPGIPRSGLPHQMDADAKITAALRRAAGLSDVSDAPLLSPRCRCRPSCPVRF